MPCREIFARQRMSSTTATIAMAVAVAVALVLAAASAGTAQIHRTAITASGGVSWSGDLTPGLGFETVMESGWVAGAQAETWFPSRWLGVRLNAQYADRSVEDSDASFRIAAVDAGLIARVLPPRRDRMVAPFIGLGAGVAFFMAEAHALPLAEGLYGDDPVMRVTVTPAFGLDLFPDAMIGARLELADKIVFPSIGESPPADGVPRVHNLRLSAGVQLRLGRPPPAIIVAQRPDEPDTAPAPAEPAAPATAPAEPAPAPARPAPEAPVAAPPDRALTVQVGAFVSDEAALAWADGLRRLGAPVRVATVVVDGLRVNRVRVGAVAERGEAERLAEILRAAGYPTWVTMPGPGETLAGDVVAATHRFMADR